MSDVKRLVRRLLCWWYGHKFYLDQIGDCVYRFCDRCDATGECVAVLPSEIHEESRHVAD